MLDPNLITENALARVAYASVAKGGPTLSQLENILDTSRTNNKALGITGVLVFSKNRFLQVLEGNAKDVDGLLEKIAADPRHGEMDILLVEPIDTPMFAEWSMGFIAEGEGSTSSHQLSPLEAITEKVRGDASYAHAFLKDCRDILLVS